MDKIERTKIELNVGLKCWVADLLVFRRAGEKGLYENLKERIDEVIKKKDLDSDTVYFCYGNPDDESQRDEVYARAEKREIKI